MLKLYLVARVEKMDKFERMGNAKDGEDYSNPSSYLVRGREG